MLAVWAAACVVGVAALALGKGEASAVDAPNAPVATTAGAVSTAADPTAAAPTITMTRHTIDQGAYAQVTHVNGVGDVNGDGRPDIVLAGDRWLVWFENPSWTPHVIADGSYGDGSTVVVHDVDGDGRADVVTSDPVTRQMIWFGNTPGGWVRHLLAPGAFCHNIDFADLNGDGRTDFACADAIYNQVAWVEAPADPTQVWTVHQIDSGAAFWGAKVADIDRDGRADIVAGRAWYRNEGGGVFTKHPYTALRDLARSGDVYFGDYFTDHEYLSLVDLNHDGRLDIVATLFAGSQEGQEWVFLAPADPVSQPWKAVRIDPGTLWSVHSEAAADFDGTGAVQIMVAEMDVGGYSFGPNPDPELLIYRLQGPADDPASWQRIRVDSVGSHEAVAVDVNGDGKVDIIGGDENSEFAVPPRNGIARWWSNDTTTPAPTPSPSVAPAGTTPPAVAGEPRVGQTLSTGTGVWSGSPTAFAYAWQRCDAAGAACVAIAGASGSTYVPVAADVGSTLRAAVTATSSAGSATATSPQTGAVTLTAVHPLTPETVVVDPGCTACAVSTDAAGVVHARVPGGLDSADTAIGTAAIGSGGAGTLYLGDSIGLDPGVSPSGNLAVTDVLDTAGRLVYELYVGPDRVLRVWSPAGGVQAASLNQSTGVTVPNDGTARIRVEVAAGPGSLVVRVDGTERLALAGLSGAQTAAIGRIDFGIDHFDSARPNEPVAVSHADLAWSTDGWIGAAAPPAVVLGPVESRAAGAFSVFGAVDARTVSVPDVPNRVLVFVFAGKFGGDSLGSVTYGGAPLVKLAEQDEHSVHLEIRYLVNPPAGPAELRWTKSGASENVAWGYAVYSGVDQSRPFGQPVAAGATGDGPGARAIAVDAASGDLVLGAVGFNGNLRSPGAPVPGAGTVRWARASSSTQGGLVELAGAPRVSLAWSPAALSGALFDWAEIAAPLHAG